MRTTYLFAALTVLLMAAVLAGCSPSSTPSGPAQGDGKAAGAAAPAAADDDAEVKENLAKLAPADRAAAEKQRVCPVTGEKLGSMGTPVKVTVKGRTVFLCCEGCTEEINKNPDKYLAKLGGSK